MLSEYSPRAKRRGHDFAQSGVRFRSYGTEYGRTVSPPHIINKGDYQALLAAKDKRPLTRTRSRRRPPSPLSTVSHLEGILVRGNGKFVERHLKCDSPTKRNYGNPKDESYCQHLRGTNRSPLYDVLEPNFQSTPRAKRLREYRAACEILSTSCRERERERERHTCSS